MLLYDMTIDEQRRIAKDMGRLAAWRGEIHRPIPFREEDLVYHWGLGVDEQCDVMSAAAAKIPLLFEDEKVSKSPVV